MARYKSRVLTNGELEFMQVLWANSEATPEEMQNALSRKGRIITGGTVRNVLATLAKKGYVTRTKKGKAYAYRAKVGENRAKITMAHDLLERVFGGSESNMVAAILKNRDVRKVELSEIKSMIDENKSEKSK